MKNSTVMSLCHCIKAHAVFLLAQGACMREALASLSLLFQRLSIWYPTHAIIEAIECNISVMPEICTRMLNEIAWQKRKSLFRSIDAVRELRTNSHIPYVLRRLSDASL